MIGINWKGFAWFSVDIPFRNVSYLQESKALSMRNLISIEIDLKLIFILNEKFDDVKQ